MIYLLTYLSGGYKVKGYLAVPPHIHWKQEDMHSWLSKYYAFPNLPVIKIAQSLTSPKKNIKDSYLPLLIYCRGGRGKFGRVKIEWLEQFASQGYLVFAPCYRGNEGGEGRDEFGGAEQEDLLSAYRFLQSLPFVDKEHISVMGFSRGAINATQLAVDIKDIHRLILWSGVADLAQTYIERSDLRRMLRKVVGGTPDKNYPAYQERSPLAMTDRISCPVLIIHGTEDILVNYQHGLNMFKQLKKQGTKVELHSYNRQGHLFPYSIHLNAVNRMFQWIEA